jgi:hypothetical protein
MVVSPRFFKTMCQQFDRLRGFGPPDKKTGCRSAEGADHPKNILHCVSSFGVLGMLVRVPCLLAGWMQ